VYWIYLGCLGILFVDLRIFVIDRVGCAIWVCLYLLGDIGLSLSFFYSKECLLFIISLLVLVSYNNKTKIITPLHGHLSSSYIGKHIFILRRAWRGPRTCRLVYGLRYVCVVCAVWMDALFLSPCPRRLGCPGSFNILSFRVCIPLYYLFSFLLPQHLTSLPSKGS